MRIAMQTWGSEGDLRPLLALAGGLAAAGHQVRFAYTSAQGRNYDELARTLGLEPIEVHGGIDTGSAAVKEVLGQLMAEKLPIRQLLTILDHFYLPAEKAMYRVAKRMCHWADLAVGHFLLHPLAVAAHTARIPHVAVALNHSALPSRWITPPGLPRLGPLDAWLNPFWWRISSRIVNRELRPYVDALRLKEDLEPISDVMTQAWQSQDLTLVAVSRVFCDPPADWGPAVRVTGHLELPAAVQPAVSPEVEEFLSAGPPPVFMSSGSLARTDAAGRLEMAHVFALAARQSKPGQRALIQLPPGDATELPQGKDVLFAGHLPLAQVLPRCSLAVHHSGGGVAHTTTQAGIPSVPVPHITDQFFWAGLLHRLGLAPRPLPRRRLTAARLAARLRTTLASSQMTERARAAAKVMAGEDGVAAAVGAIQERFGT